MNMIALMQVLHLVDSIHSAEDFVQLDDGLLRTIESYDRFFRCAVQDGLARKPGWVVSRPPDCSRYREPVWLSCLFGSQDVCRATRSIPDLHVQQEADDALMMVRDCNPDPGLEYLSVWGASKLSVTINA